MVSTPVAAATTTATSASQTRWSPLREGSSSQNAKPTRNTAGAHHHAGDPVLRDPLYPLRREHPRDPGKEEDGHGPQRLRGARHLTHPIVGVDHRRRARQRSHEYRHDRGQCSFQQRRDQHRRDPKRQRQVQVFVLLPRKHGREIPARASHHPNQQHPNQQQAAIAGHAIRRRQKQIPTQHSRTEDGKDQDGQQIVGGNPAALAREAVEDLERERIHRLALHYDHIPSSDRARDRSHGGTRLITSLGRFLRIHSDIGLYQRCDKLRDDLGQEGGESNIGARLHLLTHLLHIPLGDVLRQNLREQRDRSRRHAFPGRITQAQGENLPSGADMLLWHIGQRRNPGAAGKGRVFTQRAHTVEIVQQDGALRCAHPGVQGQQRRDRFRSHCHGLRREYIALEAQIGRRDDRRRDAFPTLGKLLRGIYRN